MKYLSCVQPLWIATLAIIVLTALAYFFSLGHSWQERIHDRFFVKKLTPPDVVVVAIDDESISRIGQWPFARKTLATALSHLDTARAVGIDIALQGSSSYGTADDQALISTLKAFPRPLTIPVQFDDRGGRLTAPYAPLVPYVKTGFVNVLVDNDGVVRRFESTRGTTTSFASSLLGQSTYARSQHSRIDFRGPERTFTTIPFIDVFEGKLPESVITDRVVLIGVTAKDAHDFFNTPVGILSGVELHANILKTTQSGVAFSELPFFVALILITLVSLIPAFLIRRWQNILMLISVIVLGVLAINLTAVLLFSKYILFPNLYLTFAFIVSAGAAALIEYVSQYREKQFVRRTFQYYLMPEIIDEIMKDPSKLALGGERKKVTILFSDIRGFTTLSESMTPEQLTHIINEYLTAMTDIIIKNKGLVDKYIGDAIMAFWGAPVANASQAADACATVIEMSRALATLNTHWQSVGLPKLGIGVGLNTGEVVVGNMGSQQRFNYTIMGDEVNFGSRLEGLNKSYGTECIVSEATKQELEHKSEFVFRELDLVIVKGKKEPKKIYEHVTKMVDDNLQKILGAFKEGRDAYVKGKWDVAITHFERALSYGPDGPSETFLERTKYLKAHPPENWAGVYEFKTK